MVFTMEDHFRKLEELIKDDDKIVTVTSYALIANISYEQSQKVLDKYVEVNKDSKQMHVTFIVNGRKKDTKEFAITQLNKETLNDLKLLYEDDCSVIIFSIQKAKQLDYNFICLAEQDVEVVNNKTISGAIIGKNCTKRAIRRSVLPTLPAPTIKGKSAIFMKQNSAVKSEEKNDEKKVSKEDNIKTKAQSQNNIASMFNKAAQVKKTDMKTKSIEVKTKKSQNISSFFPNQLNKKSNDELAHTEIKESKDVEIETKKPMELKTDIKVEVKNKNSKKSDLFDSDTDEEILKDLHIQEEALIKKRTEFKSLPKNDNKRSHKKKRPKSDVGNDKSVKKRKRIVVVEEDSDSNDILGSDKSDEDIIEKSDEEPPEPINKEVIQKSLPDKNKRRKAVKKTYEDDEGYIVTQTEYVYETASEDENEPDNKVVKKQEQSIQKLEKKSSNSEPEVSPNKRPKNKKGAKKAPSANQPTIMNFFMKK